MNNVDMEESKNGTKECGTTSVLKKTEMTVQNDVSSLNEEKRAKKKNVTWSTKIVEIHENSSDLENDIDFTLPKKKKKKKSKFSCETITDTVAERDVAKCLPENLPNVENVPNNTFDDYSYDYLLSRIFNMMREKNPKLDEEEGKKKLIMKPPQVLRVGTKKSSFVNFLEICRILRRTPQHVQHFLMTELGTTGSVDGNSQLIIKGKFQQKQIESVLRKYIREYVTCHTCHSPNTLLERDTRLYFLQCEACGSRCSVTSIKSGFQAVINKRAAMRAKAV